MHMLSLRYTMVVSLLVRFKYYGKISGNFLPMLNFHKIYNPTDV